MVAENKRFSKFNIENYLDKTYGRLTIIGESSPHIDPKSGFRTTKVLAMCECGLVKAYLLNSLKRDITKSCGCLLKKSNINIDTDNSIRYKSTRIITDEYRAWINIKTRCNNRNRKDYKNYGGRGIFVCDEWLNSFETFFKDMGQRPSKNHSIERRENDKGYSKDNCYWATRHEQCANRRSRNKVVGVSFIKDIGRFRATLRVNNKTVLSKLFDSENEAIEARKEKEKEFNISIR